MAEIQSETAADSVLQCLVQVILQGWPDQKEAVPSELHPYFAVTDELTAQDGILFKGLRCVIPASLRPKIRERLHGTHTGVEGCLRRTRKTVYWPSCLCTVDYYSSYFEINQLKEKTGKEVIGTLKRHFSTHGIPNKLQRDNGPLYNSHEFQQFMTSFDIEHVTSSPHYPQSNGMVENAIKTAKNLLQKSKAAATDIYLALLAWRNTLKFSSSKNIWSPH